MKEYKNYLKIAKYGLFLLFLLLPLFDFMSQLLIVVALFLGTEKGLTFFRNRFSENAGLKFLGMALIFTMISFIGFHGFNKRILVLIPFSILLFGFPFFILQWKNRNIQNLIPTWRDFLTLFYIYTSGFIIFYYLLTMEIWIPLSILIYLILFLVVRNFSREDIGYKFNICKKDVFYFVGGFLVLQIIYLSWELDVGILFSRHVFEYLYSDIIQRISSPFESYIHYIFITGLGEELEFRGLLLGLIKRKLEGKWYGTILALLISSFAFGFAHYFKHDFYRCIFDSIYGLILGIIFIRTKKLVVPILLHAFGNLG